MMCLPAGHSIAGNIAEVPLKQGDVLIVEAGPEFQANFKNNRAFSLISEVPKSAPLKRSKMWIALLITLAMVSTQVCRYSLFDYQLRATLWHYLTEAACDKLPGLGEYQTPLSISSQGCGPWRVREGYLVGSAQTASAPQARCYPSHLCYALCCRSLVVP
jgi:hypothetical protein